MPFFIGSQPKHVSNPHSVTFNFKPRLIPFSGSVQTTSPAAPVVACHTLAQTLAHTLAHTLAWVVRRRFWVRVKGMDLVPSCTHAAGTSMWASVLHFDLGRAPCVVCGVRCFDPVSPALFPGHQNSRTLGCHTLSSQTWCRRQVTAIFTKEEEAEDGTR